MKRILIAIAAVAALAFSTAPPAQAHYPGNGRAYNSGEGAGQPFLTSCARGTQFYYVYPGSWGPCNVNDHGANIGGYGTRCRPWGSSGGYVWQWTLQPGNIWTWPDGDLKCWTFHL